MVCKTTAFAHGGFDSHSTNHDFSGKNSPKTGNAFLLSMRYHWCVSPTSKICRKCKKDKPLEEFYRSPDCRFGRMARCKVCVAKKLQETKRDPKRIPKEKKCNSCLQVKPASEFSRRASTASGLRAYCKVCCDLDRRTPRRTFTRYKQSARDRKLSFKITFEDFLSFQDDPCTYCGDTQDAIGLDRTDPAIGYEIPNLTRCCGTCNYMKRHHSVDEWLDHLEKILFHMGRIE